MGKALLWLRLPCRGLLVVLRHVALWQSEQVAQISMRCWASPAGCMIVHSCWRQPDGFNCVSVPDWMALGVQRMQCACRLYCSLSWVSATLHGTNMPHKLTAETCLHLHCSAML